MMTALGSKTVAAGMRRFRQEERKIAVPNSRLAGNREAETCETRISKEDQAFSSRSVFFLWVRQQIFCLYYIERGGMEPISATIRGPSSFLTHS
jgi:hypothetical protein